MVEAALVGVMNGGAITPLGRAALFGSADEVATIAASIFAVPVSTFTVSGDLTVLAPAELDATTSGELSLIADITSKGTASVYKITELSLRRAFDGGRTPEQIMAFLEVHARPGVPQPLRYLVDDVARRYGSVRIGAATSYVRVEDAALLAEMVHSKKLKYSPRVHDVCSQCSKGCKDAPKSPATDSALCSTRSRTVAARRLGAGHMAARISR